MRSYSELSSASGSASEMSASEISASERSVSEMSASERSVSECSTSHEKIKKKQSNKPKTITGNGAYILDQRKRRCTLHYIEEFINFDAAERLHSELNIDISNYPKAMGSRQEINLEIEDNCVESEGHPEDPTPETNLTKQISFLTKKIEKSASSIFDLDTTITNILIKRLPSYNDHIPYESFAGKHGAKPTVAILSLGAPRSLKLKRGTKVTHLIPMHSGSLCVLSGNSTLEYMHSIPKGKSDIQNEQLVLFFIGSPSTANEETRGSDQISVSPLSVETPSESSEGGGLSVDDPFRPDFNVRETEIPDIIITPNSAPDIKLSDAQTLNLMEKGSTTISSPSAIHPPLQLDVNSDDLKFGPASPEDTERTVILVDNHTVPPETFISCVAHLPESILNEELARNGCSTEGSLTERRARLTIMMCKPGEPARSTLNKDSNSKLPSLAWVQTIIENQVIDIKQELEKLTSEVNSLKCSDTSIQQIDKLLEGGKKEM